MKQLFKIGIIACCFSALLSCQAVFTYSPVAFLQRAPANLSTRQKLESAKDAIVAGSASAIEDAYATVTAIIAAGDSRPETALLAADLAFASSGITNVISDIFRNPEVITSATPEEMTALIDSLDINLIAEGVSYVQTASESEDAEISDTQYIIAGSVLLVGTAIESGDFSMFDTPPAADDPEYDDYQDASALLAAGGIDSLAEFFSFE